MTNIADCLNRAVDDGHIDKARAKRIVDDYTQLYERYRTTMPDATARVQAAKDIKEANKAATARRRHLVLNQLRVQKKLYAQVAGAKDPAAAIRALLEYSEGTGYRGESVRSLTEAYEQSIHAGIAEVLNTVGLDVLGRSRNGKVLTDMIREMHGEATGNAQAKALAEAVQKQQQRMRRAFNSFGGDIGNLSDYGVRHTHDAAAIANATFETWAPEVHKRLAWDRIVDHSTGKPFAAAPGQMPPFKEVQAFLQDVYDGITTGGWDDRAPSMTLGGRALANQRGDHRVLHFKSGQDWIDYNAQFGGADLFSAMMGGLHGLARDVALMRVLGPNPRLAINFAEGVAQRRAVQMGGVAGQKMAAEVRSQANLARTMLAHQNGTANVADNIFWATAMAGTRAVLTSAQLGSAVLSSVTDAATITAAAQTLGMSGSNVMARSVKLMASAMDRADAARAGYVAETLADTMAGHSRFVGSTFASGLPDKLASFTLRATGLSMVTDMRKLAFQMEFGGYLAAQAENAFDALPSPLRQVFNNRGITPADWDMLRDPSLRFKARNGADFITPFYWLEHQTALPRAEAEGLAMRLQAAIREQLEYAVPTASLEARARLIGNDAPGTFAGEFKRSAFMYKSFALSLTLGQYRRLMQQQGAWNKWKYGAKVGAMLTAMGALAIQLKELAKGNDPRPMTDGKFLMAAVMQGGGLGIFGDFFSASENRVGGGIAATLAGPVVSLGNDVLSATIGNAQRALKGENTTLGRDATNLVRKYTPFLASSWQTRAAFQRLVTDELAELLDPEAMILARRRVKRQERDYGTQSFLPTMGGSDQFRLPDFGNALRVQQ